MNKSLSLLVLFFLAYANVGAQEYERYVHLLDTTVFSKNLGYDKDITITVPFEWQAGMEKSYPIIVVFDRQNPRSHQYIINTIDYLTSNEQMPSSIIVGIASEGYIEHNGEEIYPRYLETLIEGQKERTLGTENEKFIFDEILPWMERDFQASKFRTLIGHSRYGYFTSYWLAKRSQDLNAVISMSPFMLQNGVNLVDTIKETFALVADHTTYYRYAIGNDYPEQFPDLDSTMNALDNPSFDSKGFLFPDADHNATPGLLISQALYDIFAFWAREQQSLFKRDLSLFDPENTDSKAHYGHRLPLSLGILNGAGWERFNEEQFDKAIRAWTLFADEYPNYSEVYLSIALAQKEMGVDYSQALAQFQKSFATTTILTEEERAILEIDFNSFK